MTNTVTKISAELETLKSVLLSTLDEQIFFSELSKFIGKSIKSDRILAYKVLEDSSAELVARNGKAISEGERLEKGMGPAGNVIRTKRSYFSNNVQRDPIFSQQDNKDINAELCVPVVVDGVVIGTIHFQSKDEERNFSRADMTEVLEILGELKMPLANMKMYLAAKFLNESLVRQVEAKEKELEQSKAGVKVSDSYKIEDKEVIGKSESMQRILEIADRVAKNDVYALVTGETGCGKEMIARRIHCRSDRSNGAFVTIDCSVLPEAQLEIELFGEEIADFTRGNRVRRGALEKANKGTIMLNNIDGLSLHLQSKLMSFINEKMAFRVNGQVPFRTDCRIIAATSKNLEEKVQDGSLRQDLHFSINTMTLKVPSLRDRREDIELLSSHFLNNNRNADEQKSLSPGVISRLTEYNWPGNVRELQSVMERAYILADGMIVEKDHLAESVVANAQEVEKKEEEVELGFVEMTLDALEKTHICRTLEHLGGNKTKTAKTLGITVKTLYNKLHSYGMIAPKEA